MRFVNSGQLHTSLVGLLGVTVALALPVANGHAQTITNGNFEANSAAFTNFPGYVNVGNPTITGWVSNNNNSGLNNGSGRTGDPFADNGTKPTGPTVAFLQTFGSATTLSQTITGFTVGNQYTLSYFVNRRAGVDTPGLNLTVSLGGTTLSSSAVPLSGGTNPYTFVSTSFTATAATSTLTFLASNPNGGDSTALLDNVTLTATGGAAAPEPGSLALLIPAGLGVVGMVRRRRK